MLAKFEGISEATATRLLSNDLLLDKLRTDMNEDEFQRQVQLIALDDNAVLLERVHKPSMLKRYCFQTNGGTIGGSLGIGRTRTPPSCRPGRLETARGRVRRVGRPLVAAGSRLFWQQRTSWSTRR